MNTIPIPENSRDAIAGFLGDAATLLQEYDAGIPHQRISTFAQTGADDLVAALQLLSRVPGAAIVIHGPAGCGGALTHLAGRGSYWWATSLTEFDTIMGGDGKLKEALRLAAQSRPAIIFVVATPAVSINNDDIVGAIDELRDEISARMVAVHTTGFRSKIAASGYEIAWQAILGLVPVLPPQEEQATVALISSSIAKAELAGIVKLLAELGLHTAILPDDGLLSGLPLFSVSIDADADLIPGEQLQQEHGIPALFPDYPVGLSGTGTWLTAVARQAGLAETGRTLHDRHTEGLAELIASRPLAGRRVYLSLPPGSAFAVAQLVLELSGEIAGISVEYFNRSHVAALARLVAIDAGIKLHVGQGQPFEEATLLKRIHPDLYIGTAAGAAAAARLGVAAIAPRPADILGYEGVCRLARLAVRALANPAFGRYLAGHGRLPYSDGWYKRSPDWYIKLEVA